MSRDHIAHGTPGALREFIGENLDMARIQAELGVTYAALGDDAGLAYAIRRLVAHTKAALATAAHLAKAREAANARSFGR
jgi:hypothetical protein